ncbi:DUF309 domain-containing protein [Bacillus massilinigeriensis]|uniref:DUF309 domain-containing protein n=1 Tax=Bacillus massilionigeriensis TaxID=1805475 RepID=UPI00096AEC0A|nr:DUF309 domain-containing protein [Bacillus massilionigeriensis]
MYPKEYIKFLAHFHGDRDYFECHEILEEYWKTTTKQAKDSIWVGFILLSVSLYHHRRNNFNGALKTIQKTIPIFTIHKAELEKLGLSPDLFLDMVTSKQSEIRSGEPYRSMNLPIVDAILLKKGIEICTQQGMVWGKESDLTKDLLIHRHAKRDRTSVIEERFNALQHRQNKRSDSS